MASTRWNAIHSGVIRTTSTITAPRKPLLNQMLITQVQPQMEVERIHVRRSTPERYVFAKYNYGRAHQPEIREWVKKKSYEFHSTASVHMFTLGNKAKRRRISFPSLVVPPLVLATRGTVKANLAAEVGDLNGRLVRRSIRRNQSSRTPVRRKVPPFRFFLGRIKHRGEEQRHEVYLQAFSRKPPLREIEPFRLTISPDETRLVPKSLSCSVYSIGRFAGHWRY
jgi:hypothetical protein